MEHKLGIIGFGGMAEYHYNTVKRDDIGITPVAVFDVREERRERAVSLGMKAYDNVEDFLADHSFDLVLVATSNNHHARYSCLAMEHGYNVICEKPAARTYAEALTMQQAQHETGLTLNIGVVNRFNTAVNEIKKLIDAGELGEVYHIYVSFRAHRSIPGLGGAFTTKEIAGGGALITLILPFIYIFYTMTVFPAF